MILKEQKFLEITLQETTAKVYTTLHSYFVQSIEYID